MNRRDFLDLTASMAVVPARRRTPARPGAARRARAGTGPRHRHRRAAPGPLNAITDVEGVLVGHSTIVRGEGALKKGDGPVRTGVTAVLPHRDVWRAPVLGATHTLNGDGELTGVHWVRISRRSRSRSSSRTRPRSAGPRGRHRVCRREARRRQLTCPWSARPGTVELNDIDGLHVKREHVYAALDAAAAGLWPRATSAAARGWSATASRAASARRRAVWPRQRRLHGRRAAPGQLRPPQHVDDRRRAGGPRDSARREAAALEAPAMAARAR